MGSPVLLVCEDEAVATATVAALRTRDLDAVRCAPLQCVAMAASATPELVLVDLGVTTLTWDVVLAALAQEPRTRTVPVVGLARAGATDHVLAVLAGVHDVLALPLERDELDKLAMLALTLPFQFGVGASTPGAADADRLILYAERARLDGTLVRGADDAGAAGGRAVFVKGALSSCTFAGKTGRRGLAMLLASRGLLRFDPGVDPPRIVEATQLEPLPAAQLEALEQIPPAPKNGRTTTILAVDDDHAFAGLLSTFLERAGYRVVTAHDGEDGFRSCLDTRPDAVVADLEMPILDGWGLLWRIRSDHRIADTPVLFLSGAEDFRMSMQSAAAGARDYLAKGRYRELLTSRLESVLAPRRELEAGLSSGQPMRTRVELVGARWTLLRFAEIAARGVVTANDGFGRYEVAFENQQLVSAHAEIGGVSLTAADALAGYLSVRTGDLGVAHTLTREANLSGPISEGILFCADRNNADETAAMNAAFGSGRKLRVDQALCDLYLKFGPTAGRGIASAVASGTTPMALVSSGEQTVAEIDPVLRDLVRRRVIHV